MKTQAAICTLCLALTTSVAAVPDGSRELKEAATKLLAWAEQTGGAILSEIILGKREVSGWTTYDPVVVNDYKAFLQELSSRLTTFQSRTQRDVQDPRGLSGKGRRAEDDTSSSSSSSTVVLPPDTRLDSLDYNDILDILGEYTKGFTDLLEPHLASSPVAIAFAVQFPLFKREEPRSAADRVNALVERSLARVAEIQA